MYRFPKTVTLQQMGASWECTLPLRANNLHYNISHWFTLYRDLDNPLVRKLYIRPKDIKLGVIYVPSMELHIKYGLVEGELVEILKLPLRYRHLISPIRQVVSFSVAFSKGNFGESLICIEFDKIHKI